MESGIPLKTVQPVSCGEMVARCMIFFHPRRRITAAFIARVSEGEDIIFNKGKGVHNREDEINKNPLMQ